MVEFQKNKWKYATISLMAILAVGFSFPQAFAAPIDSVLTIVKDIQSKVNNSTFGLQAIDSKVTDIQNTLEAQGSSGWKGVTLRQVIEPSGSPTFIDLLPYDPHRVYIGHVVFSPNTVSPVETRIICGDGSYIFDSGPASGTTPVEIDFACNGLTLNIWYPQGDPFQSGVVVAYQEGPAEDISPD